MMRPEVSLIGGEATAHPERKLCGHVRHVGTCPVCQRAARMRSRAQLSAAVAAREIWARGALPPRAA
jgi:hypothetical protein